MASNTLKTQEAVLHCLQDPEKLAATVQAGWYVGSRSKTSASWDARNGANCLHVAAWYGLDFAIPTLLDQDPNLEVDSLDFSDNTPLMYACRRGNSKTAALLLALHADPSIECAVGRSAIIQAALGNHVETVRILLNNRSVDINRAYARMYNYTVLMIAAQYEMEAIVKCLLQQTDININLKGSKGYSALCLAATTKCKAIVNMLLERKDLEIDSKNDSGATALIIAAENGRDEMVRSLLDHRADPALQDHEGDTAILKAMEQGHCSVVTVMLDSHIDFAGIDSRGRNLLHNACLLKNPRPDVVRLLIDRKIGFNVQDSYGQTPLHMASRAGSPEVVQVLMNLKANLNIKDAYGRTALEVAWQYGRADIVKMLSGKTSEVVRANATLPLWALARLGREDLIRKMIIKSNLDEREPDTGKTALHVS